MATLELQLEKIKNNVSDENWHVSTLAHRLWLASGCTMVLISLAKSILLTAIAHPGSSTWLEPTLAALAAYLLLDLFSGIYHWAMDNYGSAKTQLIGSHIESFQGHHDQPWAITKRQLANNLYIPAMVTTAVLFPTNIFSGNPVSLAFVGAFMGWGLLGQQAHAWAHTPKGKLHPAVVALQDAGIILSRAKHGAHHQLPYNSNYCMVSGVWNKFLDRSGFFGAVEVAVFHVLGVRPRSWSDTVELNSQG